MSSNNSAQQKFDALVSSFALFSSLDDYRELNDAKEWENNFEMAIIDFYSTQNEQLKDLIISDMNQRLMTLQKHLFCGKENSYLNTFIKILSQAFPYEHEHIFSYLREYDFTHERRENILIQGDVQSGKTMIMILVSLCYLACNKNVIIVFRTSLDDKNQFQKRFEETVETLSFFGINHPHFVFKDSLSEFNPHSPCAMGLIYYDSYMKKLLDTYEPQISQTVLFVDEADLRDEDAQPNFVALQEKVLRTIFVSATVQDIMVSNWNIPSEQVITLTPSLKYRGIESLQIDDSMTEGKEGGGIPEWIGKLYEVCLDEDYSQTRPEHPRIVLISTERKLSTIEQMYQGLKPGGTIPMPHPVERRAVMTYSGAGIKLYHNSPLDKAFPKKEIKFKKNVGIKDVLLKMAQTGELNAFLRFSLLRLIWHQGESTLRVMTKRILKITGT